MKVLRILKQPIAVTIMLITIVTFVIFVIVKVQNNNDEKPVPLIGSFSKISDEDAKSSIASASAFIEIKNEGDALVAQISNPDALKSNFPFLQQSFEGDILISTKDQTIIFDSKTNTIRDISNTSIYNEMSQNL